MKKLYARSKLGFALVWIGIYCVLQSLANPLNEIVGVDWSVSAVLGLLQTVVLLRFLYRNSLQSEYGLCRSSIPASRFLYYVPLVILASSNLWHGMALNYTPAAVVCRIAAMLCVGFLEELIFRGFLFKALLKDGTKTAVVVSSVTFGLGHAINLANGSGASLLENLCQIAAAVAIGFLFVIIFWRSGSLLPCIITHAAINSLGTFARDAAASAATQIMHSVIIIAIAASYALFLNRSLARRVPAHPDTLQTGD